MTRIAVALLAFALTLGLSSLSVAGTTASLSEAPTVRFTGTPTAAPTPAPKQKKKQKKQKAAKVKKQKSKVKAKKNKKIKKVKKTKRGRGQSRAQQRCIAEMNQSFAGVAEAQGELILACVGAGSAGALGSQSIGDCATADTQGSVALAEADTLAAEAAHCRKVPDFGYTSGAITNSEARASEFGIAHSIFGPSLDAAIVAEALDPAGAACQQAALAQVGACVGVFTERFESCSASALAAKGREADYVACKGADPLEEIAAVCLDDMEALLAASCGGLDLDALFPGCAELDHAVCLGAKAKAGPSQGFNTSAGICEPVDLGLPPAPTPEPTILETLLLPAEVLGIWGADYLGDDETILAHVNTTVGGADPEDRHVATFQEDGSGFTCLTCGGAPVRGRNIRVLDAQRGLTRRDVIECTPSLLDCQSHEILPIVYPTVPGATINQPLALWESPDGRHVGWTHFTLAPVASVNFLGELLRCTDTNEGGLAGCDPANDGDRYEMDDIEVIGGDVRTLEGAPEDLSVVISPSAGEFKGFCDAGRSMAYFVPTDDANWDLIKIDVATGALTRLTRHISVDEVSLESPDAQWFVVSSVRNTERLTPFSELQRPPLTSIGTAAPMQALRLEIVDRPCCNGHDRYWHNIMLDRHGDRGFDGKGTGYIGQDLATAPDQVTDWAAEQGMSWKSDSTAFIWIEHRRHALGGGRRLQKVTFPSRAPTPPLAPATPVASWAQRLDQPGGPVFPPTYEVSGTVHGQVSGHATVTWANDPGGALLPANGLASVEYLNYSDDGQTFLNGSESLVIDLFGSNGTSWDAELTGHGCRQQSLHTANMELFSPFAVAGVPVFKGQIQSVNDDSVIEHDLELGLPTGAPGVLD